MYILDIRQNPKQHGWIYTENGIFSPSQIFVILPQKHKDKYSRLLISTVFYTRENYNCKCPATCLPSKYSCSWSFRLVENERGIIVSRRPQVAMRRIVVYFNWQFNVIVLSFYIQKETFTQYSPFILTEICEYTSTITGPYLN